MKKKFPKTFKVEISTADIDVDDAGVRRPSSNEAEMFFRAKKEEHLANCLKSYPMGSESAALAGIDPKKILAPLGDDGEDDERESLDSSEWSKALELIPKQWQQAQARIKANYLSYLQDTVMHLKLPSIDQQKDWGTYIIEGLQISSIDVSPEQCEVDPTGAGLTIRVRGASGAFASFDWKIQRTKMPKTQDSGHAIATFRDLAADLVFDVSVEDDNSLELGETEVKITLGKMGKLEDGRHAFGGFH
jgi:hypothetical protein